RQGRLRARRLEARHPGARIPAGTNYRPIENLPSPLSLTGALPATAIVRLVYRLCGGASAELAMAGKEGIGRYPAAHGWRDHAESGRGARQRLCLSHWP